MSEPPRNRRIDRVLDAAFLEGLADLSLDELRARRDECLAEREYLSLLRRLLQGRAEILKAEVEAREHGDAPALVERLATILADEEHHPVSGRGEMVRVVLPEEELMLARRRVERLVNDVQLSNPGAMDDRELAEAIETLGTEEAAVSASRREVFTVLDTIQGELKRRYKDDPSLALH
jgi:hypothetical protein